MLATLTARNLTKSFGAHLVLDRVSFTVAPGERIGIVAPNGTGKTTLLRLLARRDQPDSGTIEIAPPNASVGYLPQEVERSEHDTVRALLARRTGVSGANADLDVASTALAEGRPGADDRYAAALERYLAIGAADFDVRLEAVATDVGLPAETLDRATATLSGGQAARVALAAVLLSRFDVVLLDEPTNDLDFAGLARLERFIRDLTGAAVIVSHDRDFLDHTITAVLEIDEHTHQATRYDGGWSAYLAERSTSRRHAEEAYAEYTAKRDAMAARAQREREWSHQGLKKGKAERGKEPDKNIRQYKKNQSEQLAGRARRTERALERLDVVDKPWEGWDLRLDIATTQRSGDVVARLTGVQVRRGAFVLGPLDLEIGWGERIAIVGANGSGKSTLLGALLGRLPVEVGECWIGPSVVFGELDQARSRFLGHDALDAAFEAATGFTRTESRKLLAKFGLEAGHVERSADTLSPGERTRAALGLLMATGTNCLVLDEPTNHLDLPAIEQLEGALDTWDGTLLLVTHDRAFLDRVATDRTIELDGGRLRA